MSKPKNRNPSVLKATLRTFTGEIITCLLLQIAYAALQFVTPVILPHLLNYISDPTFEMYWGYIYVVEIVLAQLIASFVFYHSSYRGALLGLKIRTAFTQIVYRKAMFTPPSKDRNTGKIVNLVSSDAQFIADTVPTLIQGFVAPLQLVTTIGLLWQYLGPYALIPLGLFLLTIPITALLGRRISGLRTQQQASTDERMKYVRELISAIRIIKYYAWETPFKQNIANHRSYEVGKIKSILLSRSMMMAILSNVPALSMGLTFFIYALSNSLDVTKVFTSSSLMNLLRTPCLYLPVLVANLSQYTVALGRITRFVSTKELPKRRERPSADPAAKFEDATFSWFDDETPATTPLDPDTIPMGPRRAASYRAGLHNITTTIKRGELVMIVGTVGSGKSSFISAALGEVSHIHGKLVVNGSSAYVPQEAWLMNGTVRENILFGQQFDFKRYQRVLEMSALQHDLDSLPAADFTLVGERGPTLSGGQRQRISIARALYADRDILFMDDPFSALDAHVGSHVCSSIQKYIKDCKVKTAIIVTNQVHFLPYADKVLMMHNGTIVEQGQYKELRANGGKFAELVRNQTIDSSATLVIPSGPVFLSAPSRRKISIVEPKEREMPIVRRGAASIITPTTEPNPTQSNSAPTPDIEEKESGNIGFSVYWYYIVSGGGILFGLGLFVIALVIASRVFSSLWLADWSDADTAMKYAFPVWLGVYVSLVLFESIMVLVRATLTVFWSRNASIRLHYDVLSSVTRATTNFFDMTPTGRLLTRLFKDMGLIDSALAYQFDSMINQFFNFIGSVIQLCFSSPYLVAVVGVVIIIFYPIQSFYRKTSIELQRLEAISRSPIITHLSETLDGAQSIRAFNMRRNFKTASLNHLDENNVDMVALRYCSAWFGMRLDFLGTLIVLATFLALVLLRNYNPALLDLSRAGLAMSATTGITFLLSSFSIMSADLETKMNSVERLKQYSRIEHEAPANIPSAKSMIAGGWPGKGEIMFEKLTISYPGRPAILKGIDLHIKSGKKVGIVGRTGAGKSTIVSALFRVVEPAGGTIWIDSVDITKIGLRDLRRSIAIIPQTPQLFNGTIRFNVDPLGHATDDQIWRTLELVQLRELIDEIEGGLDAEVDEGGSNISVGQRQLLAMARALLRNAKILILDEASSSTDSATDRIIQKMIRKQFKGCTILCVAHRLETIIDYDYVVVMSSGAVVEYDTPKNLLDKADGQFTKMVNATGRASSANLKKIANMTAREREKAFHTVTESSSEGGFKEFPETDESDVFADDDDSGSENL